LVLSRGQTEINLLMIVMFFVTEALLIPDIEMQTIRDNLVNIIDGPSWRGQTLLTLLSH